MLFMCSEQRARHTVAERAIATLQDSLRSPALAQRLGTSLGSLTDIADRLYVPNTHDGLVKVPRQHRNTDNIAVIALHRDDTLNVPTSFVEQTEKQRVAMAKQLAQAGMQETRIADRDAEDINRLVASAEGSRPVRVNAGIHTEESVRAETWATGFPIPIDRSLFPYAYEDAIRWSRTGRPSLLVRYDGPDTQVSPSAMLHESVHIDQLENLPLQPIFDRRNQPANDAYELAVELPAYRVGAFSIEARLESGTQRHELHRVDRMQLAVEGIRQAICSPSDPFDSASLHTATIFDALRRLDIA
jgi:hypothetical protein